MNSTNSPVLALTILVALVPACADDSGGPTRDTGPTDVGPTVDPEACSSGIVPHRLGFSWEKLNHRISKWDHRLGTDGDDGCLPTVLAAEFVGGPFSGGMDSSGRDTPTIQYGFRARDAPDDRSVGFARRRLDLTIGPAGSAEGSEQYSRRELRLRNYETVVALVEGFRVDTDIEQSEEYPDNYNPAHGYTVHAVGASVAVSELSAEDLTVDYRLEFDPGASADRDLLNRAVPHARVAGRLDVLLVGLDRIPFATGSVEYRVDHPKPSPGADQEFPPAPLAQRRVVLGGQPGAPVGIWGVRSFRFELSPRIDCTLDQDCPDGETCRDEKGCTEKFGPPGLYLRELSVDVRLRDYLPSIGRGIFSFTGYASNDSDFVAYWPMRTAFRGEMVWIQAPSTSETVRYTSEFETGHREFTLDEMRDEGSP